MKLISKSAKRRGVSEIIGTLLILAITVAGAVLISNAMKNFNFPMGSDSYATSDVYPESVLLIGYDTRDSLYLSDVSKLSNNFDQLLCTNSCSDPSVENKSPLAGGTDFIVLHIRNIGVVPVYLHNVLINNEGHSWDSATANQNLDATGAGTTSGEFPSDGKFSIIPINNGTGAFVKQSGTNELQGDEEVRVVVKLSNNIPQDIGMWDSMRILVNFGGSKPVEFLILSGDAKW